MSIRRWHHLARPYRRDKPGAAEMTEVRDFQVIGELKDDAQQLLLMGDDGRCYAYDLVSGGILPLEPDDSWAVDVALPTSPRMVVVGDRVAS